MASLSNEYIDSAIFDFFVADPIVIHIPIPGNE